MTTDGHPTAHTAKIRDPDPMSKIERTAAAVHKAAEGVQLVALIILMLLICGCCGYAAIDIW